MENENIDAQSAPADLGIGAKLREARERKGLSAETVSRETMLTLRYVQALESDDYASLPGTAFVRGYVRRYAELVGLSADELIAAYDETLPSSKRLLSSRPITAASVASPLETTAAMHMANKLPLTRVLVAVAVIGLVLYVLAGLLWQNSSEVSSPAIAVPIDIDAAMTADVAEEEPDPLALSESFDETADAGQATEESSSQTEEASSLDVPPKIETLSFDFTGTSWISVRDGTGQELVYGLKNAGQSVTVSGQPPFAINIGSVGVTQLSYNGTAVDLQPFARGNIASFRLGRQD